VTMIVVIQKANSKHFFEFHGLVFGGLLMSLLRCHGPTVQLRRTQVGRVFWLG
jgi:hypothetical protein